MRYLLTLFILARLGAGAHGATPYLIGADANPAVVDGRIVTNGYDDATGNFVADVRYFGYTPASSGFTQNPGFNAFAGSGLPTGQQFRFDAVRRLVRWDGTGGVAFAPITTGETVRYAFGSANAVVDGSTDSVAGFSLGNVSSGGAIHRHVNAYLENASAGVGAGLYFTALRLSVSGGAVQRSDALYIAYNRGLTTADFQRGMAYLADPRPGDANFDARVDFDDLLVLAQNYATNTDASWFDGDFNRDRAVGFDDLLALAQQYGTGALNGDGFDADWALARSIVPEPATSVVVPFILAMARRRRGSVSIIRKGEVQ